MRFIIPILTLVTILLFTAGCGQKETVTSAPPSAVITTVPPAETTAPAATPPATTATPVPVTEPAATTVPPEVEKHFQAASPAVKFTAEDIDFLGLDFSGTPEQIADAIQKWQEDTWTYAAAVMDFPDVSDPIRWNYFLPGIFTSRDIIHEQVKDGKIYGVCFSYAITYSSIAEYYGLETRVQNTISKPSDSGTAVGFTTGMSPDEYNRLKIKLNAAGLDYSYEAIRLVAEETPTHYWAEVKIDGQWVIKDATQKATGNDTGALFVAKNDNEVTDWLSRDRSAILDDYQTRLDNGEFLSGPGDEEPGSSLIITAPDYVGVTDDLGNEHRASSIDDVMQRLALVPYFEDVSDAYDFVRAAGITAQDIADEQQLKQTYEQMSGKKMYTAALLMCQDKTDDELAAAYYSICGEELDLAVLNQLEE